MRTGYALAILALLFVAYANHFENGFHFDDGHAIVDNTFVRQLRYVPRYFVDATTFSVLPLNQAYRPVLQTTFAVDYWIGGGYRPSIFQIDTFVWFLLLLGSIFALFATATRQVGLALAATALFAFHPVSAETVNYIVQRGEVLSTLGVVASLAVYARWPAQRWTCAYLIPFVLGALAKPPVLVFPAMLLTYATIVERRARPGRDAVPSLIAAAAVGWWMAARTPPTLVTSAGDRTMYLLTQPFVALRYFGSFFAPIGLSADSDWPLVGGPTDPMVIVGAVFVMTLLWTIWRLRDREPGRFIAFGLAWFVLALLPTSLTPLAEVANDHRMFFPFVGLSLAVVTAGAWLLARLVEPARLRTVAPLVVGVVLVAGAVGVRARNEVWRTDETLWRDVTEKSPRNGRGWMNYGLALMARGDVAAAIAAFDRAEPLTPNYSLLFINRAVAYGSLSRHVEAEQAFVRAITIAPADWRSHTFYARWLTSAGRHAEALAHAQLAAELNPADPMGPALVAENARVDGTPEFFLARSLAEHQMSRYRESLASAERAIAQRPDYAEAFNNVAAAHLALGEWDEAIKAAEAAVRLNPRLQIAQNNLAWARQQKSRPR